MCTRLSIARYRFTIRAEQPLRVPEYPGSMLRGSFGHGLRSVSCVTRQRTCEGCPLMESCHYPALFEPRPTLAQRERFPSIPAPFVLEADNREPQVLAPGEHLSFHMNLFGPALDQLATIVLAWQRALWHGLGKGRARCTLQQVEWQHPDGVWQPIFDEATPLIHSHSPHIELPEPTTSNGVGLELLTPTRIQHHGRFCNSHTLNAEILLANLLRRVSLYADSHGFATPPPPEGAEAISLRTEATVQKWQRYSSRQQRAMSMDGLVGRLTLTGKLDAWLPWLWLGQYTHLGKNTSFGLGQYRVIAGAN